MTDGEGGIEHLRLAAADGVTLHAVAAGPADGPLVLLLHGFPEFWYGWRKQLGPLAGAGFRVVAPDQRGYNLSDKPPSVADYVIDRLAADVVAVAESMGYRDRPFALAGHDWGGVVAWWTAVRYPERLRRLAVLNAPHPAIMPRHARRHPAQAVKSWYVLFFQLPALPETLIRMNGFALGRNALVGSARPGTFSADDLDRYAEAWAQPGALTAMLNWYRALLRFPPRARSIRVPVPTRVIWGARDRFLERSAAEASLAVCDEGRLDLIEEATHWAHLEEPERVNGLLIEALR